MGKQAQDILVGLAALLASFLLLIFFSSPNPIPFLTGEEYGWWNATWAKCMQINITGSYPANYSHLIELNTTNFNYSNAQDDLDDLRFFEGTCDDPNVTAERLGMWNQSVNTSGTSEIWVKNVNANIPSFAVYYSNPLASSVFNISEAFLFADDFNDGSIDASLWNESNDDPTESGGYLVMDNDDQIQSIETFDLDDLTAGADGYRARTHGWTDEQDEVFIGFVKTISTIEIILKNSDYAYPNDFTALELETYHGGAAGTANTSTSTDVRNNVTYQLSWKTNEAKAWGDDLLVATETSNVPDSDDALSVEARSWDSSQESTTYLDYMVVAYYLDTEPTYSFGEEEEEGSVIGCEDVLSAPGIYTLTHDVDCTGYSSPPYYGLFISSDNVSLDLNGYSIKNGESGDVGIVIDEGLNNISIDGNGGAIYNFDDGIDAYDTSAIENINITNLEIFNITNSFGIMLKSNSSYIANNIIYNADYCMELELTYNGEGFMTVDNNTCYDAIYGIVYYGGGDTLVDQTCTISNNNISASSWALDLEGIYEPSVIVNNTISDAESMCIYAMGADAMDSNMTFINNTVYNCSDVVLEADYYTRFTFINSTFGYNSTHGTVFFPLANFTSLDDENVGVYMEEADNIYFQPDWISINTSNIDNYGLPGFNTTADVVLYSFDCANMTVVWETDFPTSRGDILSGGNIVGVADCTDNTANFSVTEFSGYALDSPGLNLSIWNGTVWVPYTVPEDMIFRCGNPPCICQPTNQNNETSQAILRNHNNGSITSTQQSIMTNTSWATAELRCGTDSSGPDANTNLTTSWSVYSSSNITADSTQDIYCFLNVTSVPADFPRDFNITVRNN